MSGKKAQIGILGRGSFGNALSFLFGQNNNVVIWDHNQSRARAIQKTRRFKKPITQKYPDNVEISSELEDLLGCDLIINALSVKAIDEVFEKLKELNLSEKAIILNGSKGIEVKSLLRPSEIIRSKLPNNPIAVLSGPNLAKEIVLGKPMVTVVASEDINIAKQVQAILHEPTLRVYTNTDIVGVELAGALKNIIAIAAGCIDGLELGESAKASLLSRGLAEMSKFMSYYGADNATLLGAAGVGDLIATSVSDMSRNYRVGFNLAKGKKPDEIIEELGEVAEGVSTTYAIYSICKEKNIHMPIAEQLKEVLDGELSTVDAVLNLMNRPLGSE